MRDMARIVAFLLGMFLIAPVVVLGSCAVGGAVCSKDNLLACDVAVLVGVFLLSGVLIWRH